MELEIRRKPAFENAVLGELFVDDRFEMFTLERANVMIPAGHYPVRLTFSTRASQGQLWTPDLDGHKLPVIEDVGHRSGIRFHAGNVAANSDGCVIVGYELGHASVGHSRQALMDLMVTLDRAEKGDEPIFVRVESAEQPVLKSA